MNLSELPPMSVALLNLLCQNKQQRENLIELLRNLVYVIISTLVLKMKNLTFRMNNAILHRESLRVIVGQFVSFKKPPRENWAKGETQKGVGYLHRILRPVLCLTRKQAWCFSVHVSFLSLYSSQKKISRWDYLMHWIDYQINHSTRMIKASLFFTPQKGNKQTKNQHLRKDGMFHGKDE